MRLSTPSGQRVVTVVITLASLTFAVMVVLGFGIQLTRARGRRRTRR